MRRLPNSFEIENVRYIHAGYAAHKVIGRVGKIMERIGPIRETAKEAIEDAERRGDNHAAFRIVQSKTGTIINGRIGRADLPLIIE